MPNGQKDQTHIDRIRKALSLVNINIHMLDAIQQIHLYALFLKELCITKRATYKTCVLYFTLSWLPYLLRYKIRIFINHMS